MSLEFSPVWISLKTAFTATAFAFFIGITVAGWMFGYRGRWRGIVDSLFTLPLVLPPTVLGFLLLIILGRNSPIGQVLRQFGINLIFTWQATVIAATVVAFPLMYKTVLGAFEQVDANLIDCARTLGASERRIFWQILIPLAWPGAIAGTVLAFARALGEFGATLMLAGSIPGKTQTIPIAIFFAAEAGKMGEAMAWTLIVVAIALIAIASINYSSTSTAKLNTMGWELSQKLWAIAPLFLPRSSYQTQECDIINSQPRGLLANLQTSVSNFTLNANLQTNGTPLGLLGESGSGKSTILRCIAGLETPQTGQIRLNGRILFDSNQNINIPARQRRIGVVFQNYALFPHLTVAQNIAFGLQDLPQTEQKQRVRYYLQHLHLHGLDNRYPHQLSGGQQQRVALARALAIAPDALLLDEPLSALDTYLRSQIERMLGDILATYDGVTLFITHKLEEAYRLCGDLLVLSNGRVIASGRKQDIFERPQTFKVAQVTECKNFSRVRPVDSHHVEAVDWGCVLRVLEPIPQPLEYLGIRAHHVRFSDTERENNTFPGWLARASETQHRMTLYLKLHHPPTGKDDYHLQVEVYKEKWERLKDRPFPWNVRLDPLRLILMQE